jgi:hypothetical protein
MNRLSVNQIEPSIKVWVCSSLSSFDLTFSDLKSLLDELDVLSSYTEKKSFPIAFNNNCKTKKELGVP